MKKVHMGEILARWKDHPDEVLWELTYKCNLHCCYCYNSCPKRIERELSSWQKRKLARKLVNEYPGKVCFTGGEPTLDKDFLKIVKIFHRDCQHPALITNGSGINEGNISKYLDYFSTIKISLDTLNPGEAALVNKDQKAPEIATKALELLLDEGFDSRRLGISTSLTDYQSMEGFKKLCEYVGELRISRLQAGPPTAFGRAIQGDYSMSPRRMETLDEIAEEVKKEYPKTNFEISCVASFGEKKDHLLRDVVHNLWITPWGALKPWYGPFIVGNALSSRLDELFGSYYRHGVYKRIVKACHETPLTMEERLQKKYRRFHLPKVEMETVYIVVPTGELWGGGPHWMGFLSPGGLLSWDEALLMHFKGRPVKDIVHIGEALGYKEKEVQQIIQSLKRKGAIKLKKARRAKTNGLAEELKEEITAAKECEAAA